MKKVFLFVSFFTGLLFIISLVYSVKLYGEISSFLHTHEYLVTMVEKVLKINSHIGGSLETLLIKNQSMDKVSKTTNINEDLKALVELIDRFDKNLESFSCINCHKKNDTPIKNLKENLVSLRKIASDISRLSVLYLSNPSLAEDLLQLKQELELYTKSTNDFLRSMEANFHNMFLKKITYYPIFYIAFSTLILALLLTFVTLFYRNFLKDFIKLTNICKEFRDTEVISELKPEEFRNGEMRFLAETFMNTLRKLQESEVELQQQFEEIKGMNEELQSANQQLELLTVELEDAKRDLERRVEEKTRQLEKAYEELRDLDRLKNNFLQSISHEFKTPLTPLFGYLKLFKNKELGELTPLQEQSIDIMLACAEKLYNTIDDLIFLARLDMDKEHYMLNDIDLSFLIQNVIGRLDKELEEKHLKLSLNIPNFPIIVKGEQLMLTQALLHLIRNAIKYTPDGGEILILLNYEDKKAVLRIIDTGTGIPDDKLEKINNFLSFADIHTEIKGSFITLGLNILKKVVQFHNAKVLYRSEKNKGTEVVLSFPIKL